MKQQQEIGWPKAMLDDLELLWWHYHDNTGKLKEPGPYAT